MPGSYIPALSSHVALTWLSLTQVKPKIAWPHLKSLTPKFPQLLAHQSPHRLKSLTSHELNQLLLAHHIAQKCLQISCASMDSSSMSLSGSLRKSGLTRCFCSEKSVLVISWTPDNHGRRFYGCPNYWVSISLFVKFLNFYSVSGFLTSEALQVPISFPISLSLFLLHFRFKLAIPLV